MVLNLYRPPTILSLPPLPSPWQVLCNTGTCAHVERMGQWLERDTGGRRVPPLTGRWEQWEDFRGDVVHASRATIAGAGEC